MIRCVSLQLLGHLQLVYSIQIEVLNCAQVLMITAASLSPAKEKTPIRKRERERAAERSFRENLLITPTAPPQLLTQQSHDRVPAAPNTSTFITKDSCQGGVTVREERAMYERV